MSNRNDVVMSPQGALIAVSPPPPPVDPSRDGALADRRAGEPVAAALGANRSVAVNVKACNLNSNGFVWVSLRHPSRGNWSSPKCTYLRDVVVPAITNGRAMALAGV